MPIRTSRNRRHAPRRRGWNCEQRGSAAVDVADILASQLPDPGVLNSIGDFFSVTHACRGVSLHQPHTTEGAQVPVQARPADRQDGLQPADRRRAEKGQVAQDLSLGPVAHEADCHLNLPRELWSDEIRHASILPDPTRKRSLSYALTLLLNDRDLGEVESA